MNKSKVGVLACSGEECLGGTISRLATRKVMENLRLGKVVSLCLPLYVAGGQEERFFAKAFPVIAVEGCDKCCAKKATEKYSGDVSDLVVVSNIIGEDIAASKTVSTRNLSQEHFDMVDKVAEDICNKVDEILMK